MAKFDVYRSIDGSMLLDCQSDLLRHLNKRFVAPLVGLIVQSYAGHEFATLATQLLLLLG